MWDKVFTGLQSGAFRIAQIASGSCAEAVKLVQDAMLERVEKYWERPKPQWEKLSVERQQRLRRGANRFKQMQPQEREQAKNQQQRFQSLSQQQQRIINQRFQRFNSLSRPQQRRLRNLQRRFQNMPKLKEKDFANSLSSSDREILAQSRTTAPAAAPQSSAFAR